jgi:hypothetical protein
MCEEAKRKCEPREIRRGSWIYPEFADGLEGVKTRTEEVLMFRCGEPVRTMKGVGG